MIPDHGNLLHDIPAHLVAEQFDLLLQTDTCRLERIVSIGHVTPPDEWYDQEDNEWVLLLQGQAQLRFADEEELRQLEPGDHVWITAHRRHRVEWTSHNPPAIWLALHLATTA